MYGSDEEIKRTHGTRNRTPRPHQTGGEIKSLGTVERQVRTPDKLRLIRKLVNDKC